MTTAWDRFTADAKLWLLATREDGNESEANEHREHLFREAVAIYNWVLIRVETMRLIHKSVNAVYTRFAKQQTEERYQELVAELAKEQTVAEALAHEVEKYLGSEAARTFVNAVSHFKPQLITHPHEERIANVRDELHVLTEQINALTERKRLLDAQENDAQYKRSLEATQHAFAKQIEALERQQHALIVEKGALESQGPQPRVQPSLVPTILGRYEYLIGRYEGVQTVLQEIILSANKPLSRNEMQKRLDSVGIVLTGKQITRQPN
jgi:hypothetical protein